MKNLYPAFLLLLAVLNAHAQYDTIQAGIHHDIQRYKQNQDSARLAASYQALASIKILGYENDSALYYYLLGRQIYEAIADTHSYFSINNPIGHWYLERGNPREARKYFLPALEYYIRTGDSVMMAHAYANAARSFEADEQFDSAISYRSRSIPLALQVKDSFLVMINLWVLSENAWKQQRYQEAFSFGEDALRWSRMNEKNNIHYCGIAANKGKILQLTSRYAAAITAYDTALNCLKKDENPELKRYILLGLSECNEAIGETERALSYRKLYDYLNEELLNEKRQRSIEELRIQFETENKEKEIGFLQREKTILLADAEKRRKNFLLAILSSVGITAIALFAFFINRKRLHHERMIQLQKEKIHRQQLSEIEQQHRIQSYQQLMKVQDRERERIARDLHDSLGSLLTGIKMHFQKLYTEISDPGLSRLSAKTAALINDACENVRSISHSMMPESLLKFGLKQALSDLVHRTQLTGLQINLLVQELPTDPGKEKAMALLRVCEEALTNIIRHAKATEVFIHLTYSEKEITLSIEDNGTGFNPQQEYADSYGIRNMKSRAAVFNGSISIESAPQKGTVLILKMPL